MRADLGIVGIFLPMSIFLVASWGPIQGRTLWYLSLFLTLISAAIFLFFTSGFYFGAQQPDQWIFSRAILDQNAWFAEVGFRWSFWSSILSSAVTLAFLCFHFLGRRILENSRASTGSLAAFLCCILGALGSGNLFLFTCFFAGTILPRFIFSGIETKEENVISMKESAFLQLLAVYSLMIVVLIFSTPFQASLNEWFRLEFSQSEVLPGSLGFLIFMFALVIVTGMFPFHENMKKIFDLEPIERAIPLSVIPVIGQVLMFHFCSEYFAKELRMFSGPMCSIFAFGFFWSAVNFWSSKRARTRVFWLQQAISALVAVGFFGLQSKGWHGAAALSFFQILSIPFLLMVLGCHERRTNISLATITKYPLFALSSVTAIAVALLLPISLGFYGAFLVVWSLVADSPWYLYLIVVSLPILVLAGMQSMFFQLGESSHSSNEFVAQDFTKEEILAIFPLGVLLLFTGLIPKILMNPIGSISISMLKKLGSGD